MTTSVALQTATIRYNPDGTDFLDKYLASPSRELGRTISLIVKGNNIYANKNLGKMVALAAKNFGLYTQFSTTTVTPIKANASIDELLEVVPKNIPEYLDFSAHYWRLQAETGLNITVHLAEKISEKKS
ncbi:MAG: hypothetical protein V4487_05170 [Chlamydiota bacterium]